jgi:hypothetical protein
MEKKMQPTTTKTLPPDQRPANRQFAFLKKESVCAENGGSLEERIRASKELLKFIDLGTLEGEAKFFAEHQVRRIANSLIKKYTDQLQEPTPVDAPQDEKYPPPCPPFRG